MKTKKMKHLMCWAIFVLMVAPMFMLALPAQAQPELGMNFVDDELGLANADPRVAVISLVKLLMTFLGIIAVVIMLYGGFLWMTAAGNEDKVSQAKKLIGAGVIGLIIILSAFLIVNFVVNNVSNALNNA